MEDESYDNADAKAGKAATRVLLRSKEECHAAAVLLKTAAELKRQGVAAELLAKPHGSGAAANAAAAGAGASADADAGARKKPRRGT